MAEERRKELRVRARSEALAGRKNRSAGSQPRKVEGSTHRLSLLCKDALPPVGDLVVVIVLLIRRVALIAPTSDIGPIVGEHQARPTRRSTTSRLLLRLDRVGLDLASAALAVAAFGAPSLGFGMRRPPVASACLGEERVIRAQPADRYSERAAAAGRGRGVVGGRIVRGRPREVGDDRGCVRGRAGTLPRPRDARPEDDKNGVPVGGVRRRTSAANEANPGG